jgi:oligopeptide transport system permease protein
MTIFERNVYTLFIALGAAQWLTVARIVRGQVLVLKQSDFIEAARALGARSPAIVCRHLLPNLLHIVWVYATLMVPAVIIEESFLSFLGLGLQPPAPSLGSLIQQGAQTIDLAPWQLGFPAGLLTIILLVLNFLGDGLCEAWDPKRVRVKESPQLTLLISQDRA